MVKAALIIAADAERALAIGYAPTGRRAGLEALFALDARLGEVVRTTREPLLGEMRLVWWRDALIALDTGPVPAEPVLAALAGHALPSGVRGGALARISEGWRQLLAEPIDDEAMTAFAHDRGAGLFEQGALLLTGSRHGVAAAGEGWALADLAGRVRDAGVAGRARDLARERLAVIGQRRWPRALRPLGGLALLARSDVDGGQPGSPRRVARLLGHRLTGL